MRTCIWIVIALLPGNAALLYQLHSPENNAVPQRPTTVTTPQTQPPAAGQKTGAIALPEATAGSEQAIDTDSAYGDIIARINGEAVRQLALLPYLHRLLSAEAIDQLTRFEDIPRDILLAAVQQYAIDHLNQQRAEQAGLTRDIKLQVTMDYAQRQIAANAYLDSIRHNLVSNSKIRLRYDELAERTSQQTEYRARHILLASEKEATIISRALKADQRSFDDLARQFSLDEATRQLGGDLGYRISGQLHPTFEREIAELPLNTYSRPFQTEHGWHIAVVTNRKPATVLPFEQAEPRLRAQLEQDALAAHANQLIEQADIVMLAADSDPAPAN